MMPTDGFSFPRPSASVLALRLSASSSEGQRVCWVVRVCLRAGEPMAHFAHSRLGGPLFISLMWASVNPSFSASARPIRHTLCYASGLSAPASRSWRRLRGCASGVAAAVGYRSWGANLRESSPLSGGQHPPYHLPRASVHCGAAAESLPRHVERAHAIIVLRQSANPLLRRVGIHLVSVHMQVSPAVVTANCVSFERV
jgi:hypothetical protein